MPGVAPELAVGGAGEADLLLHGHHVGDSLVLDLPQRRVVQLAGGVLVAGAQQPFRPQEAADVVGAEGRGDAGAHARGTYCADRR